MAEAKDPVDEFNLKLVGPGIDVERVIDAAKAGAILGIALGFQAQIPSASFNEEVKGREGETLQVSLREFLDEVQATRKPDQIVAIGQYMSLHEGLANFSRDDVRARFSSAKEPMPGNFARDFSLAIRAGSIAEAHQKPGFFYITKTGIQMVERHFAGPKSR